MDTHALVWNLDRPERLGAKVRAAIEAADEVRVSPISFFEICRRVRIGKWPGVAARLPMIQSVFVERGGRIGALGPEICLAAAMLDWAHRDPFDQIIAATALAEGAALVSADTVFDAVPGLRRVW